MKKVKISNKSIMVLGIILILISVLFVVNSIKLKNIKLDDVIIKGENIDKDMFAIMVEQTDGTYSESTSNSFPGGDYSFNQSLSGCVDGNGDKVDNVLKYNATNKKLSIKVNKAVHCYLYFSTEGYINIQASGTKYNGGNSATVSCANASVLYNNRYDRVEISSVSSSKNKCELVYNTNNKAVNFADYITSLIPSEGSMSSAQGDGYVVSENGYRYEGRNPNNYVWFNNELWRIIGVFGADSHGVENTNLVKIIRASSLGTLVWNKTSDNDWETSSLYNLLNDVYYDWGTNNSTASSYCYGTSSISSNCDYSVTGIKEEYRKMITTVNWYLGGGISTPATTFTNERTGTSVYEGNSSMISDKVGLMYASDFGYSVLENDCPRTTELSAYGSSGCSNKSWLYSNGAEYTITHNNINATGVLYINDSMNIADRSVTSSSKVRPVVYLDSSVIKVGGTGTQANPYIIAGNDTTVIEPLNEIVQILKDNSNNISEDLVGGMYRFQGTYDVVNDNYICFAGVYEDNSCDYDRNLYRIIGSTPDGNLKLISNFVLNRMMWGANDSWDDEQYYNHMTWPDSDIFDYLNYAWLDDLELDVWSHHVQDWDWKYGDLEQYYDYDSELIYTEEMSFVDSVNASYGLMQVSDYFFAHSNNPGSAATAREGWIYLEWNEPRAKDNKGEYWEWLMAGSVEAAGDTYKVIKINNTGAVRGYGADSMADYIRPVFYLRNDIQISGSGTEEDPYIIAE